MEKKVFFTRIIENRPIAEGVQFMAVEYPDELGGQAVPGQFVNLYLNRKDLLLPRPISICRIEKNKLILVYGIVGTGTKELASYSSGTLLRISSPLGNGYNLSTFFTEEQDDTSKVRKPCSAIVVGGGIGIPPLLELTHCLIAMGVGVDAVLGFRDEPFLLGEFEEAGARVHVATDNGRFGYRGTVLELLKREGFTEGTVPGMVADIYFACGPTPMLRALTAYCGGFGVEIQVSMEERMGCGFGACVGCACSINTPEGIVQRKVCKDGPVFVGKEVIWDA